MNCPLSGRARISQRLMLSAAGLIAALSAPTLLHAEASPEDRSIAEQLKGGEYKRGETPTGQDYGIIKKGDPHKSDALEKEAEHPHKKHEMKSDGEPGRSPGAGSTTDRDKRESHEGSGPDPFGRY